MMLAIVIGFLFLSILFYVVFGGADFGVGILEFFSGKKNRNITKTTSYSIIGPIWEANHIWLIICIVILWIGFPNYYNLIVTQLHFPISLLLVGIIGRGTAFVFRHYDAFTDNSQYLYDRIFQISSVFTPFFIGVTAGAVISGEMIHPDFVSESSFTALYIYTWLNPFALTMGLFIISIFAFISAIFLVGETENEVRTYYLNKAKKANISAIIFGLLLFLEAFLSNRKFIHLFIENYITFSIFIIVTLLLWPLWVTLQRNSKLISRLILGLQLFLIVFVWGALSFPNLIIFKEGTLSILDNTPPDVVFTTLGYSLLIAAAFVLPGLYHLYKTFGLITK
jgi:cytochrome d ubiquinol oxidase subunit II